MSLPFLPSHSLELRHLGHIEGGPIESQVVHNSSLLISLVVSDEDLEIYI